MVKWLRLLAQRAAKHGRPGQAYSGTPSSPTDGTGHDPTGQTDSPGGGMATLAAVVVTASLFGFSSAFLLPQISKLSGGRTLPDARLLGYDLEDIQKLRAGMSPQALAEYTYFHLTADLILPLLISVTLLLLARQVLARGPLRRIVCAMALLYAIADYAENVAIDTMLNAELDAGAVQLASALTIAKVFLLLLTLISLLAAALHKARSKRRRGAVRGKL